MTEENTAQDDLTPSNEASETPAPEPEASPEPDVDEPVDNKERSRLGRRFTQLESEFGGIKDTLTRMEQMLATPHALPSVLPEDEYDSDKILTVGEFEKYERTKREKSERQQAMYRNTYVQTIKSLGDDPDMHAEIEKELLTNVAEYPTHTGHQSPAHDAKVNYRLARAAVIEKKFSVPKPNVRGGTNAATGVTATTRTQSPPKQVVKLDEATSKFAKAMGLAEDSDFVQQSVTRTDL
uniref:Uncharacterized protein n=1 Tax=viral metagenome TaxID=1070528 RepID=A0A6M3JVU0_9ZZZZ